jgi:hypothetical protein
LVDVLSTLSASISLPFLLVLLAAIVLFFLYVRNRRGTLKVISGILSEREVLQLRKLNDQFGNTFLSQPKTFYYLDESAVESLFNTISPTLRTMEVEKEVSQERKKDLRGTLAGFGASYGSKSGSAEKEKKQSIETPESKYESVVQYLLENEKVTLGLEEFSIDKSFEEDLVFIWEENLDSQDAEQSRQQLAQLTRKAFGEQKLKKLGLASGYVLIAGEFVVVVNPALQSALLSFQHPVSDAVGIDIKFSMDCTDHLRAVGMEILSKTSTIRVGMLAEVIGFSNYVLTLKPFGIHSIRRL